MYVKSHISFLAAILLTFAVPTFAQQSDVRVCMDARILYGAKGWDGSTYDYTLERGGTIIPTLHNDSIIVQWNNTNGVYQLGVRETSVHGCIGDWAFLNVEIVGDFAQFSRPNYIICGADSCVYLDFNKDNFLTWSWDDAVNPEIVPENGRITKPGTYWLETFKWYDAQTMCRTRTPVEVSLSVMPTIDLRPDTMICTQTFTLYALNTQDNPPETEYIWSTGETGLFVNIISSGTNVKSVMVSDRDMNVDTYYRVTAEVNGCEASAATLVRACVIPRRDVNIPNTFTPNDDGDNDTWEIPVLMDYPNAVVEVFDRLGRRVFISPRGYPVPWNGTDLDGRRLPFEAYYYIIHVNDDIGTQPVNGTITIIR